MTMTASTDELESRVVVFAPAGRDGSLTAKALAVAGMGSEVCGNASALIAALQEGAGALLLTEQALVPAILDQVRACLGRQPPWSDLPVVVVASKRSDDRQGTLFHQHV